MDVRRAPVELQRPAYPRHGGVRLDDDQRESCDRKGSRLALSRPAGIADFNGIVPLLFRLHIGEVKGLVGGIVEGWLW